MKIGVLSDTHIPKRGLGLPELVLRDFKSVDHIIHAGDIMCMQVIDVLAELAPVTAVAGNVDPPALRALFGEKKIITLGGFRFGICHGHGKKGRTMERAIECFKNDAVDCIIFGHSHIPCIKYTQNTILFNPGSPTDKRRNKYYSFGIIETGVAVLPRLVYFN